MMSPREEADGGVVRRLSSRLVAVTTTQPRGQEHESQL